MLVKKNFMACTMAMTLALGIFSGSICIADPQEPTGGEKFADAIAVRPMTLFASGVGLAAWVVTLPFTLFSGEAGNAGKAWVLDPLEYTFVRPLGDIRDNRQD